jgi:hypothetical protein
VSLVLDVVPDVAGTGLVLRVVLTNTGDDTVDVAGRLAVGYERSTDRELYVRLRDPGTGTLVGRQNQLYQRAPHRPADVRSLRPGESVEELVPVDDWYDHPAGALEVQVVYDPREAAASSPSVVADEVLSAWVEVVAPRSVGT